MADPKYPLVNETLHEWSSVEIKFEGRKYDEGLDPQKQYGTSVDPIGRTRGPRDANGDIELYLEEYQRLMADMGAGFYEQTMQITVSYSEDGLSTIVDQLVDVRIKKINVSQSQGADALTRKLDLSVMKVLWNGLDGVKNPLTGASAGA
jgi:hypothetical protein